MNAWQRRKSPASACQHKNNDNLGPRPLSRHGGRQQYLTQAQSSLACRFHQPGRTSPQHRSNCGTSSSFSNTPSRAPPIIRCQHSHTMAMIAASTCSLRAAAATHTKLQFPRLLPLFCSLHCQALPGIPSNS
jgi:hypothetical protein